MKESTFSEQFMMPVISTNVSGRRDVPVMDRRYGQYRISFGDHPRDDHARVSAAIIGYDIFRNGRCGTMSRMVNEQFPV